MVDPGRIRALLDRLAEEITHLRRLASLDVQDLLADPDRVAAVKYRFIVVIETCIDVGEHIVASEGLRAPTDFADTFAVLAEGGFLQSASVPALQGMARFRNLLVHGYRRVDDVRVAEILRSRLGDLDSFRKAIAAAIAKQP